MRLLNTKTGKFQWVEDPRRVHYAILSHVWAHDSEQNYQDLLELQKEDGPEVTLLSKLSDKLRRFCETALKDGFEFGWADTCCIDKTSSSELSEAINSMYTWYGYSGACYAFLHDVKPRRLGLDQSRWRSDFAESKWFTRGWTLQELIASPTVIFVSKAPGADGDGTSALARVPGWEVLGSKHSLAALISSKTGIDIEVLTFEKSLEDIPIARRMAWMQDRKTTRVEDEAYCLMGIFGVNMQTNYGEGRYAFIRLQEKILLQNADQTIFAWGSFLFQPLTLLPSTSSSSTLSLDNVSSPDLRRSAIIPPSFPQQYLLASSPREFDPGNSAKMVYLSREAFQERLGIPITEEVYQVSEATPYGLRMHFPILSVRTSDRHPTTATHCAVLACEDPDRGLLALLLRLRSGRLPTSYEFFAGAIMERAQQIVLPDEPFSGPSVLSHYRRLAYITSEQLESLRTSSTASILNTLYQPRVLPKMSVVYIPHRPSRSAIELDNDSSTHEALCKMSEQFEVRFSRWSRKVMELDGYSVDSGGSDRLQNEPSAESDTLTRTPSSRGNIVTISNKLGVYLTVQVGRCSCDLAQRNGILGVLVSSLNADSLERPLLSQDGHWKNHPIHVYSWTLEHGFASRQIEFDHPTKVGCRLSLRLTLTSIASPPGTPLPQYHTYLLSAELIAKELSELPQPRQLLPINPAPSRSPRPRANSLPLNVLSASASPDSSQSRGHEQATSATLDVPGATVSPDSPQGRGHEQITNATLDVPSATVSPDSPQGRGHEQALETHNLPSTARASEGGRDHPDNRTSPPERNFFVRSWKTILDLFH